MAKTRRSFLMSSAGAAGGSLLAGAAPLTAASQSRIAGANDRIRVALIGCGGMGSEDLTDMLRVKGTECVALCDIDDARLAGAQKNVLDPAGQKPVLTTRDFRNVIAMKDLDVVIVATPDHWHALPTVMACQAGKDVYVEKPLSVSIGESRIMVDTARKYGRVVQMGTQQRSAEHYRQAIDYVKSGKLGKIRVVRAWAYHDWLSETPPVPDGEPPTGVDYDLWLGPARTRPFNKNRFHFSFRWFWDYSGGLMTDWGAHMIDVANWGMDVKAPRSAASVGGKFAYPQDAMETPDTQQVIWAHPGFTMIWEHALGIGRGPEAREHGVAFHGADGLLVVDRAGWEVYSETNRLGRPMREFKSIAVPRQPASARDDYHLAHVQNFIDCVRSRQRPRSDVEIGHNSMIACHLANIAQRLGRQVNWDVENERVLEDAEAQKFVMREYRAPWKLA